MTAPKPRELSLALSLRTRIQRLPTQCSTRRREHPSRYPAQLLRAGLNKRGRIEPSNSPTPFEPHVPVANRRTRLCLRRPPLGPVAPKAHDMVREYHVCAPCTAIPQAPEVFLLCEDPASSGSFFIMERRRVPSCEKRFPDDRGIQPIAMISEAFWTLSEVHAVDASTDEYAIRKVRSYVDAVRGWADRWSTPNAEVPEWRVVRWLPPECQSRSRHLITTITSGHIMLRPVFRPDRSRARLGDGDHRRSPSIRFDTVLRLGHRPGSPRGLHPSLSAGPGWYTRDQLWRVCRTHRTHVTQIGYYEVLGSSSWRDHSAIMPLPSRANPR